MKVVYLVFMVSLLAGIFFMFDNGYSNVCDWATGGWYRCDYSSEDCSCTPTDWCICPSYIVPCVDTDKKRAEYVGYYLHNPIGGKCKIYKRCDEDDDCDFYEYGSGTCAPGRITGYYYGWAYGCRKGKNFKQVTDYYWNRYPRFPCGSYAGRIIFQDVPCEEGDKYGGFSYRCNFWTPDKNCEKNPDCFLKVRKSCLVSVACAWVEKYPCRDEAGNRRAKNETECKSRDPNCIYIPDDPQNPNAGGFCLSPGTCKSRKEACLNMPKGVRCEVGGRDSQVGYRYKGNDDIEINAKVYSVWSDGSTSYNTAQITQGDVTYTEKCGGERSSELGPYNLEGCYKPERNCFDGLDDNFDGRIDCFDPTCRNNCSSTFILNITKPSNVTITFIPKPTKKTLVSDPTKSLTTNLRLLGNQYFYPPKKRFSTPLYSDPRWEIKQSTYGLRLKWLGEEELKAEGIQTKFDERGRKGALKFELVDTYGPRPRGKINFTQTLSVNEFKVTYLPAARSYPDSQIRIIGGRFTYTLSNNGTGVNFIKEIRIYANDTLVGKEESPKVPSDFQPQEIPLNIDMKGSYLKFTVEFVFKKVPKTVKSPIYLDSVGLELEVEYTDNYTIYVDTDGNTTTWELVTSTHSPATLNFAVNYSGLVTVKIVKTTGSPDTFGSGDLIIDTKPLEYTYIIKTSAYAYDAKGNPVEHTGNDVHLQARRGVLQGRGSVALQEHHGHRQRGKIRSDDKRKSCEKQKI